MRVHKFIITAVFLSTTIFVGQAFATSTIRFFEDKLRIFTPTMLVVGQQSDSGSDYYIGPSLDVNLTNGYTRREVHSASSISPDSSFAEASFAQMAGNYENSLTLETIVDTWWESNNATGDALCIVELNWIFLVEGSDAEINIDGTFHPFATSDFLLYDITSDSLLTNNKRGTFSLEDNHKYSLFAYMRHAGPGDHDDVLDILFHNSVIASMP